jgi:phage I-like protein
MLLRATFHSVIPDAGAPPEWVHLVPAGSFTGQDGRGPYRLADPEAVIQASMAAGKLPIDENHATDLAMKTGQPSPARGWIVGMEMRQDGLWGRVEWTATGAQLMGEQAYRGISPVFEHDKDGVILRVLRAAVTNTPNLPQLAKLNSEQGPSMDLSKLRAALGLPETADEDAILATVTAHATAVATHGAQIAAIAQAAGLDARLPAGEVAVALQTQSAAQVKPETVVALQTELATLKADRAREKAAAFVDGAITGGKPINPTRDFWIARHIANPAETEATINALPSIHASGGTTVVRHDAQDGDPDGLDDTERMTCQRMGLDPKKFAANKKRLAEAAREGGMA